MFDASLLRAIAGSRRRVPATPPFSGRANWYAELDTRASHTGTTNWQTFLSLSIPAGEQTPSGAIYILWSCGRDCNSAGASMEFRLRHVEGSANLAENIDRPDTATSTNNYYPAGGVARLTSAGTPVDITLEIQYRTSNSSDTVGCRNGRIWATKAGTDDAFAENTGTTLGEDSYTTAVTLSHTPGSSGDFLYLWSGEYQNATSSGHGADVKLDRSGAIQQITCGHNPMTSSGWCPVVGMIRQTSVSGAQSVTLQVKNSAGFGTDANLRNARVMALRLDNFAASQYAESLSATTYNSSTSDQNRAKIDDYTPEAKLHVQLGLAVISGNNGTNPVTTKLKRGGSTVHDFSILGSGDAYKYPALMIDRATLTASSQDFDIDYGTSNTGTTVGIEDAVVALLRIET